MWVEFDGREKYTRYLRDGETVTDAVLREKRREERVRELTGWICVRIAWAELADPRRSRHVSGPPSRPSGRPGVAF